MNGPLPTQQISFLSELSTLPLHSKVRFLGCVTHYDISSGRLILEHKYHQRNYPATTRTTASTNTTTTRTTTANTNTNTDTTTTTVPVDINHLLETVKAEDLQVGAWLNVIGYIRRLQEEEASRYHRGSTTTTTTTTTTTKKKHNNNDHNNINININNDQNQAVYIEAIMIVSAGAVHVGEYERVLRDVKEVERRVRRPT